MATNETTTVSNDLTGWMQDGSSAYLVKFADDPTPEDEIDDKATIWLYNSIDKTYRPFVNIPAIQAAFGENYVSAMESITILPTSALNSAEWGGKFLPRVQGVQADGTFSVVPKEPAPTVVGIYGAQQRVPEYETPIANGVSLAITKAKEANFITQATFDKYLGDESDNDFLSKATSAYLYGGYAMSDILRDIKAKELANTGNAQYADIKGFDSNMRADDWYKTKMSVSIKNDPNMTLPQDFVSELGSDLLSLPLFKIPSEAFKTLVEPVDWTSPEFKAEAEQIKAAWFDATMQIAEAQTEQAKAVANENYDLLKKNVEKKYGLKLSENAVAAWGQLEGMFAGYSEAGMLHSGFMNKAMDKYMKAVRKRDDTFRDAQKTEEEIEQRNHLLRYGTAEQIQEFIATNGIEKAKNWGLIPDEDTANYFSMENLRKEFPEMTEEEISMYKNILLDPNGNFTSELYQNLNKSQFETLQGKKEYQQLKLFYQKLDEEKAAYKEFEPAKTLAGDIAEKRIALQPAAVRAPTGVPSDLRAGYEAIPGPITPGDLEGTYADWYTSDDKKTLYGKKKLAEDMGISEEFKMPFGYAKVAGRPDLTMEEQDKYFKSMYKDIRKDPTNTFLYGKPTTPVLETTVKPISNLVTPEKPIEPVKPIADTVSAPADSKISPSDTRYWGINPNRINKLK